MLETTRDVPLKPAVFLMATVQTGLARAMLPWPAALPLHVGVSMNLGNDFTCTDLLNRGDLDFSIAPPASCQTNSCQTKVKRPTTRRAHFNRLHTTRCAPVAPDPPYGASVPLQSRADHFNDRISKASKRNFFAISGKPVDTIVDQVSAALPAAAA
jgi:hypothetical protein